MSKVGNLREVLGKFVTGVTVVTVANREPVGITANSFTSVSLDPPLILVCIHQASRVHKMFSEETPFAVNILSEDQNHISGKFSEATADRANGISINYATTGAPILAGALAYLECRLHRTIDAGDHTIILGQVEDFETQSSDARPLVFYDAKFTTLDAADHDDHGLIRSISVPGSGRIPDPESGIATSAEYDNYFRLRRETSGLASWTRTCLDTHQELVDDLGKTSLSVEEQNDLLRGLVSVQETTLSSWLSATEHGERSDQ